MKLNFYEILGTFLLSRGDDNRFTYREEMEPVESENQEYATNSSSSDYFPVDNSVTVSEPTENLNDQIENPYLYQPEVAEIQSNDNQDVSSSINFNPVQVVSIVAAAENSIASALEHTKSYGNTEYFEPEPASAVVESVVAAAIEVVEAVNFTPVNPFSGFVSGNLSSAISAAVDNVVQQQATVTAAVVVSESEPEPVAAAAVAEFVEVVDFTPVNPFPGFVSGNLSSAISAAVDNVVQQQATAPATVVASEPEPEPVAAATSTTYSNVLSIAAVTQTLSYADAVNDNVDYDFGVSKSGIIKSSVRGEVADRDPNYVPPVNIYGTGAVVVDKNPALTQALNEAYNKLVTVSDQNQAALDAFASSLFGGGENSSGISSDTSLADPFAVAAPTPTAPLFTLPVSQYDLVREAYVKAGLDPDTAPKDPDLGAWKTVSSYNGASGNPELALQLTTYYDDGRSKDEANTRDYIAKGLANGQTETQIWNNIHQYNSEHQGGWAKENLGVDGETLVALAAVGAAIYTGGASLSWLAGEGAAGAAAGSAAAGGAAATSSLSLSGIATTAIQGGLINTGVSAGMQLVTTGQIDGASLTKAFVNGAISSAVLAPIGSSVTSATSTAATKFVGETAGQIVGQTLGGMATGGLSAALQGKDGDEILTAMRDGAVGGALKGVEKLAGSVADDMLDLYKVDKVDKKLYQDIASGVLMTAKVANDGIEGVATTLANNELQSQISSYLTPVITGSNSANQPSTLQAKSNTDVAGAEVKVLSSGTDSVASIDFPDLESLPNSETTPLVNIPALNLSETNLDLSNRDFNEFQGVAVDPVATVANTPKDGEGSVSYNVSSVVDQGAIFKTIDVTSLKGDQTGAVQWEKRKVIDFSGLNSPVSTNLGGTSSVTVSQIESEYDAKTGGYLKSGLEVTFQGNIDSMTMIGTNTQSNVATTIIADIKVGEDGQAILNQTLITDDQLLEVSVDVTDQLKEIAKANVDLPEPDVELEEGSMSDSDEVDIESGVLTVGSVKVIASEDGLSKTSLDTTTIDKLPALDSDLLVNKVQPVVTTDMVDAKVYQLMATRAENLEIFLDTGEIVAPKNVPSAPAQDGSLVMGTIVLSGHSDVLLPGLKAILDQEGIGLSYVGTKTEIAAVEKLGLGDSVKLTTSLKTDTWGEDNKSVRDGVNVVMPIAIGTGINNMTNAVGDARAQSFAEAGISDPSKVSANMSFSGQAFMGDRPQNENQIFSGKEANYAAVAETLAQNKSVATTYTYVDGGNISVGVNEDGTKFAIVGKDSVEWNKQILKTQTGTSFSNEQVLNLMKVDYGVESVISLPQVGYHNDLGTALIGPGTVLVNDSAAAGLLERQLLAQQFEAGKMTQGQYVTFVNESVSRQTQGVELENAYVSEATSKGLKVERMAGAFAVGNDQYNFINIEQGTSPKDGSRIAISLGGPPELQAVVESRYNELGIQRVYFLDASLTQNFTKNEGAFNCLAKTEGKIVGKAG